MRGKDRKGRQLLLFGGSLSITIALLHVAIIFIGAPAYRFTGAGEIMAGWAEQGQPWVALITLGLAAVFTVWGLYAFSGAGAMCRRLPLLRTGLIVIAALYTLRGLMFFPEVWLLMRVARILEAQHPVFSLISLSAGIMHILGLAWRWERLSPPKVAEA